MLTAYEAIVALGARVSLSGESAGLAAETARMRTEFERRTGAFGPEDPWFEVRSRAFWDDAVTTQRFGEHALSHLREDARFLVPRLASAHRGFFTAHDVDDRGARLVDLWSGAELLVGRLDEAQAVSFEHAEGPFDARVVAADDEGSLFALPGAFHHGPDAIEPALRVLSVARERKMETGSVLDALLKMELVFRSSSRVKASFAYRVESLPRT